ncbi:MAG: helix-turn-helix domain-containing protein [Bacteroidetes bacterium]|nr:helix-turn-helix domain-containing protein [Bacteroidota bacterium]
MTVGERLRQVRGSKSLEEFCNPLSVKGGNISSIENGRSKMSIDLAIEISEVYRVSLDWLLKGIGTKNGEPEKVEEPQADYITISKDELIQLQRLALGKKDEQIGELKKQVAQTKNIEGVATGQ